jgi:D-sedoheptulose 7-phosphate isomerase
MRVVAFTGRAGDKLAELADVTLRVPSTVTSHIQEVHLAAYHLVSKLVEDALRG